MGGQAKDGNQTVNNANLTAPLETGFLADGKDSDATKFSRTNLKEPQFTTNPQSIAQVTSLEEAENLKRNAGFKVPVESPVANDSVPNGTQKSRSFFKPIGIAAAIAVLAGGGFAGWYAMNNPSARSVNEQPAQKQILIKNETQKPQTEEVKQNANTAVVTTSSPEVQTASPAIPQTKNQVNPPRQTEPKPNTQTIIAEKTDKPEQPEPKPNPENSPKAKTQVYEVIRPGTVFVPEIRIPEFRVEDIPGISPEEREEIRKAVRLQRQVEAQRRAAEKINRKRAEQGLPPIAMPPLPPEKKNAPKDKHP
jgi:hypothetical protein